MIIISKVWEAIDRSKRLELLREIYGYSFDYIALKSWNEIPFGIKERIKTVYNNFQIDRRARLAVQLIAHDICDWKKYDVETAVKIAYDSIYDLISIDAFISKVQEVGKKLFVRIAI